jgi:ubiquinone/menaquinone biosynthesis C-methylase UbiE
MKSKSVFDVYAHEYDFITNAAARESYHTREIQALIDRFHPTSVLDAGCASGLTSLLFAKQGIKTVGLDRSRKMIEVAKATRGDANLPLSFRVGHFERLPKTLNGRFDLIVCLANSISGLDSVAGLRVALAGFHRVLVSGGSLVLQALNFAAIREGELFPIKVTRNAGIVYTRYSRRIGKRLEVHVTRLDLNADPPGFEPFCHQFYNFTVDEIAKAAKRAGFVRPERFEDLYLSRRYGRKSRDLVLVVRKP